MNIINPDFKLNDLNFLSGKKKILKSGDLYDLINNNDLKDFDPLEEAFKLLDNGNGELSIKKINKLFKKLDF